MKLFSRQKEVAIHLVYWMVFLFGYFVHLKPEADFVFGFDKLTLFGGSYLFVNMSTFYLNYLLVLKNFVDVKMPGKFVIGLLLIFSYFIICRYVLEEMLFWHLFGARNYFEGTTIQYYIFDNLSWGSTPVIASTIMWLVINYIRTLQKEVALQEAKKKAEIQFLKSQINPHFIFNTLNNIYSMVFLESKQALPAIEKLSEIMRFTTYETQKELIAVGSEIKYIQSFIDLESIRNAKPVYLQLEVNIVSESQLLPPYLLMPFVENCVKHGILDDVNHPVIFSIHADEKSLILKTQNQINSRLKDDHSGIGLENLRKRLDYYYPDRYQFEIWDDGTDFKTELHLQL